MSKKIITVVVPVYNAMTSGGGYIERAVESVARQSLGVSNIELLLINDGSTDHSSLTLKMLKDKYPKLITLINQSNKGVAKTRNRGIRMAKGEYIAFLDQDDWFDNDFLEVLYKKSAGADVVISGYKRPDINGRIKMIMRPPLTQYGAYTISAAWAKLHRTEFLKTNNIRFFSTKYGEDNPFTIEEILKTKKIITLRYVGYNWFVNKKSVSNTSQKKLNNKTKKDMANLMCEIGKLKPETNNDYYNYYLIKTLIFILLHTGMGSKHSDYIDTQTILFKELEEIDEIFTRDKILSLVKAPKGESFLIQSIVGLYIMLYHLRLINLVSRLWCKNK